MQKNILYLRLNPKDIHWNVKDCNLYNKNGKVSVIDTGHDNSGVLWAWYNEPNNMNGNIPEIVYDVPNGWLDDLMQVQWVSDGEGGEMRQYPNTEGVAVEMSGKILFRGAIVSFKFLSIFHINANGVTTVEVVKP